MTTINLTDVSVYANDVNKPTDGAKLLTDLNILLAEINAKDLRIAALESGSMSISGVKTFTNSVIFSSSISVGTTSLFTGAATFSAANIFNGGNTFNSANTFNAGNTFAGANTFSAANTFNNDVILTNANSRLLLGVTATPGSLTNGMFWYNTTTNLFQGRVNGATLTINTQSFPVAYRGTQAPVYSTSTQFLVNSIADRDSTNAVDISKTGSTTVDIATTGINGVTLGSANLTGTVSVTAASAAVTFSVTQAGVLKIGDTITTAGGQVRRLSAGAGTAWTAESNWTSTETTVTVKRGGRGASTHYYLYSITDGTTPGLILSTRNVVGGDTLADLPSGYTYYRQVAFAVYLDTSRNLIPFRVGAGWPSAPKIIYSSMDTNVAPYRVLTSGASTSFAAVALNTIIPAIARLADIAATTVASTGPSSAYLRETGLSTTNGRPIFTRANASAQFMVSPDTPTNSSQSIDYKVADNSMSLDVFGYTVTAF